MSKRGLVEQVIVLIVMIVMFMIFSTFIASITEATPELSAAHDVRSAIEAICTEDGSHFQQTSIFLPAGNNEINLGKDGFVSLKTGDKTTSKKLNCPSDISFADCTIGPTVGGQENVPFGVNKTGNYITLNDTLGNGDVRCATA